ncbi:MAG TPA: hypothetical protein VFB95_13430 [Candidatus Cryosericum sp.]|nr:hypothetical protein [Candidatus Cryosericum sp.]
MRAILLAVLVIAAAVILAATPAGRAAAREIQQVFVTNFPEVQRVSGAVSVDGPVRHASLVSIKDIRVPPVEPKETGRLIDGGVVSMDGFTSVVISLSGQTQGKVVRSGAVGAILVPEEETITTAFDEDGQIQFPLQVSAVLTSLPLRSFASQQERFTVGFPKYRVHLYNTTEKTATVSLFAYLTN